MMTDTPNVVFEDLFKLDAIDKDGKKFDRGTSLSRVVCVDFRAHLLVSLYPCSRNNDLVTHMNQLKSSHPSSVSRIFAQSDNYEMQLTLDVNVELYPMAVGDKFTMVLARSLNSDGVMHDNEGYFDATRQMKNTLANDYEYVMYGKVYKFDENKNTGKV